MKLQKEKPSISEPYPWLEPNTPGEKIDRKEFFESTINLSQSCLSKE